MNGEEFVTPIEQINPLLSEDQEGFVRYTSHKKNSDWFGYIGQLPLGKTGDKQGMVKDVIFKPVSILYIFYLINYSFIKSLETLAN